MPLLQLFIVPLAMCLPRPTSRGALSLCECMHVCVYEIVQIYMCTYVCMCVCACIATLCSSGPQTLEPCACLSMFVHMCVCCAVLCSSAPSVPRAVCTCVFMST